MAQSRSKKPRRKFNPNRHAEKILSGYRAWSELLTRGAYCNARTTQRKPLNVAVRRALRTLRFQPQK